VGVAVFGGLRALSLNMV